MRSRTPLIIRAFTVGELAMSVAILGIIAAIAIAGFQNQMEKSKDGVALAAVRNVASLVTGEGHSFLSVPSRAQLSVVEPEFVFTNQGSTGPAVVSYERTDDHSAAAAVLSDTGACYLAVIYLNDETIVSRQAPGTFEVCSFDGVLISVLDPPTDPEEAGNPEDNPAEPEEPGAPESTDPTWVSLTTGLFHTCGITTGGTEYCWGYGLNGQIGNGSIEHTYVPAAVSGGHTWVSTGGSINPLHSNCRITASGAGYCWGYRAGSASPVLIAGGIGGYTWDSLTLTDHHTCGVTVSGAGYCWGNGTNGVLGNGLTTNQLVPFSVYGDHTWASISTGVNHTCGITTSGAGYCWGVGSFGRLGHGFTVDSLIPVPVSGGHAWASITLHNSYTCGVTAAGAAYCWGLGASGRLGNGGTANSSIPVPVSGGHTWASISGNEAHICGITTSGAGYCWGVGGDGRLGNGGTVNSSIPVAVSGDHTWASITARTAYTCGVTTTGEGYCWGAGASGKLGNGDTANSSVPVSVSGNHTWASITPSTNHTCGITTSGDGYCWGLGGFGQLGNGLGANRTIPVAIAAP